MKTLFDKTTLAGMNLKNRFFRSATWVGLCNPDGTLKSEIIDVYRELAKGGVGVIITELTDVSRYNSAMGDNMRLYSDALIPDYKQLVSMVHEYGAIIIPQLNIDQYACKKEPHQIKDIDQLTLQDIENIKKMFVEGAIRAQKCGFDGIQLHLAYGWLLYRFLNPMCNHRKDNYGGNVENRIRITVEIIKEIKKKLPNMPVCAKFSFYPDYQKMESTQVLFKHAKPIKEKNTDIYAMDECAKICSILYAHGLDFIEVLGDHSYLEMGNQHASCYADLAKAVQKMCDIPIVLTGTNLDIDLMEKILNEDNISYFGLSRPLIREPELINRWQAGDRTVAKCMHCDGCYRTKGKRCAFN